MALPLKAPRSCGAILNCPFLGSIVGLFVNMFSFRNCGARMSMMMKQTQHECRVVSEVPRQQIRNIHSALNEDM
jgi:hypothetical protein